MRIPPDILKNSEAFLALLSALLCLGGIFLSLSLYAALYISLGYVQSALLPQIDSAQATLASAGESVSLAANTSDSASQGLSSLSSSLASYSDSARNISDSLTSISAVPPFSLDARFASAAKSFKAGTEEFQNASLSLNQTAASASGLSASVLRAKNDIAATSASLSDAKSGLKNAFFMLNIASLIVAFALIALFSSGVLLSTSILLSHYPRLFEKSHDAQQPEAKEPRQRREEPGKRGEDAGRRGEESGKRDFRVSERTNVEKYYPPGYREWKPGQGSKK